MKKLYDFVLISLVIIGFNVKAQIAIAEDKIISHNEQNIDIRQVENELRSKDNLVLPLEKELELLHQMNEFELGKFLLKNKGLNGYWTSYTIMKAPNLDLDNKLEQWFIHNSPVVKATRERSKIFQQQIQHYIKYNSTLASVPCGTMEDLYNLNLDGIHDIKLVGMDLDPNSLELARSNYIPNKNCSVELSKKNAWDMDNENEFDIIVSNGLNIYEPDDDRVSELYQKFAKSLKEGGVLITSFLTPPPEKDPRSTWRNYSSRDVKIETALLDDIVGIKWKCYRTEDQTRQQLQNAGLKVIDVIYDSQGMFPTIVARK